MQLDVNTSAAVIFSNKLERMKKSSFPIAVRNTLNSAAFDVKKDTMPRSANRAFINRQPNFFKANSRVEMAKGWRIDGLKSIVGFVDQNLSGEHNFSVKDLEQQESGGTLKGKSFIPLNSARGGNNAKPVRPANRISKIGNIANSMSGVNGKNRQEKFVKSALHAGKGGYVLGNFGDAVLWRIDSIRTKKVKLKGLYKKTVIKKTALYTFEKKRSVRVSSTDFMSKAANESAKKLEAFYLKEAERQIAKLV